MRLAREDQLLLADSPFDRFFLDLDLFYQLISPDFHGFPHLIDICILVFFPFLSLLHLEPIQLSLFFFEAEQLFIHL